MSKDAAELYAFFVMWHAEECDSGRRDEDMTIYHSYDRLAKAIIERFDVKRKADLSSRQSP